MNELEKCAEILVECGYADIAYGERLVWIAPEIDHITDMCNPFADTLEGRRQADSIEDWLGNKRDDLWFSFFSDKELYEKKGFVTSGHKWRLDRIKYCIQQLIKRQN